MVLLQQDELLEEINDENLRERGLMVDEENIHENIQWNNKLLNVLHVNIRSVKKNFDSLILLLESFNLKHNDVVILSECFKIWTTDQYNIPGYNTLYNQADFNRNDGVIVLVKSDIDTDFFSYKLPVSMATVGRMSFAIKGVTFGITALYRPPPVSKQDFIGDLHTFLQTNVNSNIEIFIGDININLLDTNDNDVSDYLSAMAHLGFVPFINSVTRPDTNTCLDHIFVNQKLKSRSISLGSFILDSHMTDHYPTMLNVTLDRTLNKDETTQNSYFITKLDLIKFKNLLSLQDWSYVTAMVDPEVATNCFVSKYKELMRQATGDCRVLPTKHKKIKKWITTGIITSIKHRDKMKKTLLKKYSKELEGEYRIYRNQLNKIIRKQKNYYYKNQIENNKSNMKKIYEIIRDACNEQCLKKSTIKINDMNGENILDERDMANYCNDYFINIGTEMEGKIPPPQSVCDIDRVIPASMYLTPLTENEIIKHIFSLRNNSAPGYDGVSADIVKQTHIYIVNPLLHIINLIFQTGVVPSEFKISIVKPIHKTGCKTDIKNFRPISLITSFAKVFEKAFKDKLIKFYRTHDIISGNQFGFMEGCGTDDAMFRLTSEITTNLNNGKNALEFLLTLQRLLTQYPIISYLMSWNIVE